MRVAVAATVVAGGCAMAAPANADSSCRIADPGWSYTTDAMTAWVRAPMSCFSSRDQVRISVRVERCAQSSCTHTPTSTRTCDHSMAICRVQVRMPHGPVEAAGYAVDSSFTLLSRHSIDSTETTTVLTCTSAVVTATC